MIFCIIYVSLALTFLHSAKAERFRILYGSCYKIFNIEEDPSLASVWDEIRFREPDAFIWGGDTVYGDHALGGAAAGKEVLTTLYNKNKNLLEYQNLVSYVGAENILGTWDDHDFGLNNAGKTNELKFEARDAFLDFYNVPLDDFRRNLDGVYNVKYLFNGRIRVILLDIRFNRDEEGNETGDFLGENQWKWFEEELNSNVDTVEVTVVVSGIQILPEEGLKTFIIEKWGDFPEAKSRLLRTITTSTSKNVVMVSGDVHSAEISAVRVNRNSDSSEYLIPEMTTSGMTHSLGTSYGTIFAFFLEVCYFLNPFSYQLDKMYTLQRNFGEMEFNFPDDGNDDGEIIFRVFTSEGKEEFQTSFQFSSLQNSENNEENEIKISSVNEVSGFKRYNHYFITVVVFAVIVLSILYLFFGSLFAIFHGGKLSFFKVKQKINEKLEQSKSEYQVDSEMAASL